MSSSQERGEALANLFIYLPLTFLGVAELRLLKLIAHRRGYLNTLYSKHIKFLFANLGASQRAATFDNVFW